MMNFKSLVLWAADTFSIVLSLAGSSVISFLFSGLSFGDRTPLFCLDEFPATKKTVEEIRVFHVELYNSLTS